MAFDFSPFLFGENLRLDGSNFIEWCQLLRDTLEKNFLLYVIEEPLRDRPDDSDGEDAYEDWRDVCDTYMRVEWLMCSSMTYDLRVQFSDTRADEIINRLKILFGAQVRVAWLECLDEFVSTMMEEKTCLDQHLVRMHEIHRRLTHVWDYWMADETTMYVVLRSLPLSYKSYVRDFVMKGEEFTFFAFLARLRTTKVEPIEAEIIDPEGIYDIKFINGF